MVRAKRYKDGLYKAVWGKGQTLDVRLKTINKGVQIVLDLEGNFCEELTNLSAVQFVPYICADELLGNGGEGVMVDKAFVEDVYTVTLPHRSWRRPTQAQYDQFVAAVNRLWFWVYKLREMEYEIRPMRTDSEKGDVVEI